MWSRSNQFDALMNETGSWQYYHDLDLIKYHLAQAGVEPNQIVPETFVAPRINKDVEDLLIRRGFSDVAKLYRDAGKIIE
jgi:hypothetical protein